MAYITRLTVFFVCVFANKFVLWLSIALVLRFILSAISLFDNPEQTSCNISSSFFVIGSMVGLIGSLV